MRLVHLADLHLGHQRFNKFTGEGINQREFDVIKTFEEVIEKTKALDPDLIVIAGDMFDTPKPSNYTLKRVFEILKGVSSIPIVAIPGNHDRARKLEWISPIELLSVFPSFHSIVKNDVVRLDQLKTLIICAAEPHDLESLLQSMPFLPRYKKIMLLHIFLKDFFNVSVTHRLHPILTKDKLTELIETYDIDYVALGDIHVNGQVTSRAYYSGSIDWVSPNFWKETETQKSFIYVDFEYDLKVHNVPITACRDVKVLPAIDCSVLTDEELLTQIEKLLSERDYSETLVKIDLFNVRSYHLSSLSSNKIKSLRQKVFHLELNISRTIEEQGTTETYLRKNVKDEFQSFLDNLKIPEATKTRLLNEFIAFSQSTN
ncbi:MAG: exonuclease SbcCD subunit D [Deltaproteobacteria bacterium]|nr:exonuclease SbcCD subunit D [Deltaproteobacteria bacterium]